MGAAGIKGGEADCSGLRRASTQRLVGKPCYYNDFRHVAVFGEPFLQFNSGHPGHLDVRDQAPRLLQWAGLQVFFGPSERS